MAATINVNVADQGYPPPPPGRQALPQNLGVLVSGSAAQQGLFTFNLPIGSLPAADVDVESQGGIAPSPAVGVRVPNSTDVYVDLEDIPTAFPDEYIVTPTSGNFKTSVGLTVDKTVATLIGVFDADTGGGVTSNTLRLKLVLASSLVPFGISFLGRVMQILTSAFPTNVNQVRSVIFWSVNTIYVMMSEDGQSFGTFSPPMPGDTIELPIQREADEVVYDLTGLQIDVNPGAQIRPTAPAVPYTTKLFQGNVLASSGVRTPFIGSGQQRPPFIGTFEVEDQPVLGGLPANVFI